MAAQPPDDTTKDTPLAPDETYPAPLAQRLAAPVDAFCEALKAELAGEPALADQVIVIEEAQRLYADGHHGRAMAYLHLVLQRMWP